MVAADRISNLHDEIIHHIMFFLSVSEVIRISVLSKRLNSVWRTFPLTVIEFDQELFEEKRKRPLDEMLLARQCIGKKHPEDESILRLHGGFSLVAGT